MKKSYIFKFLYLLVITLWGSVASVAYAIDLNSASFIIRDPIIGTAGGYSSSGAFQLSGSGNTALSGLGSSATFIGRYGFLYYSSSSPPTVVSVYISTTANGATDDFSGGAIDLTPATTRTVYVNGVVEDIDGRATITAVTSTLHRSGATGGSTCTNNLANCYVVSACTLGDNANINQKTYSCLMDLSYISQSTNSTGQFPSENWVAYVSVSDGVNSGTNNALTKEVNSMIALNIPSTVAFGVRNVLDITTSANNVEMSITQNGNVRADVNVSMNGGLACTRGSIPLANLKWAISDVGYTDGLSYSLTSSPDNTILDVPYGTNATPAPAKSLYWNISIPNGVGGYCSNALTITAVTH